MATDTRKGKSLTLADLCQAIADGRLCYTLRDGEYEVSALDLRRFRRGQRVSRVAIAPLDSLVDSLTSPEATCQM
jgi:hypothetical protein